MSQDLIERLQLLSRTLSEPWEMPIAADLMREAAAALEAEASEGERRGLERALEFANFEAEAWGYADGSSARVAAANIARAIRELPEAPAREGWQPIETAPRDRAILVYDTGQGRCIAYWAQWHDNLLGEDREGWRTMGDWERLDWVTHWMAIPGPPPPQDREPDSQRGAK